MLKVSFGEHNKIPVFLGHVPYFYDSATKVKYSGFLVKAKFMVSQVLSSTLVVIKVIIYL